MTNFSITPLWGHLSQRYNVLAFDRPGWGLSARVARGPGGSWPSALNPYSYEFVALTLRSLLTELGLWDRPKIILGHR